METRKKAQAAMEFLMTYGWAILVVLIAIGALAYFGVLNPDKFLPEKCVLSTGSGLYCDDYSASAGTVTLRIKNILNEQVAVANVTITATGETCTSYTTSTNIPADDTRDFPIACSTVVSGDKVKGDIVIIFTPTGGLAKTSTGSIVTTAA